MYKSLIPNLLGNFTVHLDKDDFELYKKTKNRIFRLSLKVNRHLSIPSPHNLHPPHPFPSFFQAITNVKDYLDCQIIDYYNYVLCMFLSYIYTTHCSLKMLKFAE